MTDADYFLAPSLAELRTEVDAEFPGRDKASDGWIGDPSHAARKSEHNPCWTCPGDMRGVVLAIDVDSNGAPGVLTPLVTDVLKATIGSPRVWYVIWNSRIYSRTYGWTPRVYTGTNHHDHHVHVSSQAANPSVSDAAAEELAFSTAPWLEPDVPPTRLPAVRLHRVVDAARHPRKEWAPVNVRRVQRALRNAGYSTVTANGVYDRATRQAVQRFQKSLGLTAEAANGVLDVRSGTVLGKDRFRLVP